MPYDKKNRAADKFAKKIFNTPLKITPFCFNFMFKPFYIFSVQCR